MTSIFTKIINGELPARFVWKDDHAVAFLTIGPLQRGHTLVVPRYEVDHWLDAPADVRAHLFEVAHCVGKGIERALRPKKVALMLIGDEVPHLHIHLVPFRQLADLSFDQVDKNPRPEDLDAAAQQIRAALRGLGYAHVSD